jgi:hypothetical protein
MQRIGCKEPIVERKAFDIDWVSNCNLVMLLVGESTSRIPDLRAGGRAG